ncbi:hypothetical protein [Rathayibacter tanaceti]|uniref:Uncharacterized protein n=1 Tax=Rathayibacter tanaceti TaxID=1671680 RepID=A0AAE6RKH3_9MICO|nr:hypothetical protein [Rathayibacter tanaceti]QHC54794.1 hypothetical protein GSU10_03445 [Rathayibacter tanaceti]
MITSQWNSRARLVAWIVVVGLIALALLITLLIAVITATILVDQIPGGDAGLATTPELESAYKTMNWSFPTLIGVVAIGILVPLIAKRRGRDRAKSR